MTALGLGLGKSLNTLGLGPSISTTFTASLYGAISETTGLESDISPAQVAIASDTLGVTHLIDNIYRQLVEASDTLNLSPAAASLSGVVLAEILGLAPVADTNQIANVTASDITRFIDNLIPGVQSDISEMLGLTVSLTVQQVVETIESLGLSPLFSPEAVYNLSWSDAVRFADTLGNFFGADVSEGITLSWQMDGNLLIDDALAETLGLADTQITNVILRVDASDELGLDDTQLLNGIYQGTVSEEVELAALYLSPGGGFTTWAMNTRTAAVTEYSNYVFNSFARMGNKYLGASADGLFELNGDSDDGTDIIADIKSGFAQFAGTRHTLFKSVYLGVRGEGDFVLRLISGEGATYDYAVSTRDMRSTKVHLGKGLRARYFAFELISEGQDFDLDTIEFVPLVAQRRV